MGYIAHDAVVVTASDYMLDQPEMPDVEAFRQEMPEAMRGLLVGPIQSLTNGYLTWFFAPDGSKEGWGLSDAVEAWRERFVALFGFRYGDGSTPFEVVWVRYGGDFVHAISARSRSSVCAACALSVRGPNPR